MPPRARQGGALDPGTRTDVRAQRTGRRLEVLALLRTAAAPLSLLDIADRLGMHPSTVRFHLGALVDDGLVERRDSAPRAPGRPPLLFAAVRGMDPGGARRYQLLSGVLAQALDGGPDVRGRALEAGRERGRELAVPLVSAAPADARSAVDRLMTVLGELDFDPVLMPVADGVDPGTAGARGGVVGTVPSIGLRRCPFLEVAQARSPVVCPVHLGLMQGALEGWAAPVTVDRLDPFVEPDLCLAHLAPAGAGHPVSAR